MVSFRKKGDSFSEKQNSFSKKKILFLFCQKCSEYDDEIECHNDVLASITVFWSFVANLSRTEEPRSTMESECENCSKIYEISVFIVVYLLNGQSNLPFRLL